MLASSGDAGPPCGVPISLDSKASPTMTPALKYLPISASNPASPTFLATRTIKMSCWTLSKNFAKSRSTAMR